MLPCGLLSIKRDHDTTHEDDGFDGEDNFQEPSGSRDEGRRSVKMNETQLNVFVDFMSAHREFARNGDLGSDGHSCKNHNWLKLARLVSVYGPPKTMQQCMRSWAGMKQRTKEKYDIYTKLCAQTGGKQIASKYELNERELKILEIEFPLGSSGIAGGRRGVPNRKPPDGASLGSQDISNNPRKKRDRLSRAQKQAEHAESVMTTVAEVSVETLTEIKNQNKILSKLAANAELIANCFLAILQSTRASLIEPNQNEEATHTRIEDTADQPNIPVPEDGEYVDYEGIVGDLFREVDGEYILNDDAIKEFLEKQDDDREKNKKEE